MTATVEIKARVARSIRDRFNAACAEKNVSASARISELIHTDIELQNVDVEAQKSIRAHEAEDPAVGQIVEQLKVLFAQNREAMAKHLAPLKATLKLDHFEKRFDRLASAQIDRLGDQYQALQRIENHLTTLTEDATKRLTIIARELQIERPALHQDRRVQFGAVAGLLFAFAAVALLPGTSWPARAVARFAVGESGDVQAASIIAAKGDKWDSGVVRLVIEANHDDRFNRTFNDCLLRAKIAFNRTRCTLDVPMVR